MGVLCANVESVSFNPKLVWDFLFFLLMDTIHIPKLWEVCFGKSIQEFFVHGLEAKQMYV